MFVFNIYIDILSLINAGRFKSRAKVLKRSMTTDEKDKALSRIKDFTSQNPCFPVVIIKAHVHDRYDLVIKLSFYFKAT